MKVEFKYVVKIYQPRNKEPETEYAKILDEKWVK